MFHAVALVVARAEVGEDQVGQADVFGKGRDLFGTAVHAFRTDLVQHRAGVGGFVYQQLRIGAGFGQQAGIGIVARDDGAHLLHMVAQHLGTAEGAALPLHVLPVLQLAPERAARQAGLAQRIPVQMGMAARDGEAVGDAGHAVQQGMPVDAEAGALQHHGGRIFQRQCFQRVGQIQVAAAARGFHPVQHHLRRDQA